MSDEQELLRDADRASVLARVQAQEYATLDGLHDTSMVISNYASIASGVSYTLPADLRSTHGVPAYARGVWVYLYAQADTVNSSLYIDSADDTPDVYSSRIACVVVSVHHSGLCMTRLGLTTGANAGKFKLTAAGATWSNIYVWVVGYWG